MSGQCQWEQGRMAASIEALKLINLKKKFLRSNRAMLNSLLSGLLVSLFVL